MSPLLGDGGGNLGALGAPGDALAVTALVIGVVLLFRRPRELLLRMSPRIFLGCVCAASFAGSLAYIRIYLHGTPRIIDATTYYLQGAALSRGGLTWEIPAHAPPESFRGRFLLAPTETSLTGIFPVGYPLLLALAFLLHAPMLLGPLLGALLTLSTYRLTRVLARGANFETATTETAARAAALLSLGSGAMRYYTADTMSHGVATLLATLAITELSAVLLGQGGARRSLVVASACVTYLGLTRFASVLPLVLLLGVVLVRSLRRTDEPPWRTLALVALFPLLGTALQLHVQHTQTGSYFTPAQSLYYRLSDGPEGCFRYGFGANIGCLNEHGAFVRAQLPHGYGPVEALKTTGRRLIAHGGDAANAALFLPFALFGLRALTTKAVRIFVVAYVALHLAAYAPFYFDGNYPGGGARLFSEIIPLEQALLALGVCSLGVTRREASRAMQLPAAALLAFAVHASFAHACLRDRDGGDAPYLSQRVRDAGVTEGLVFFDTDHGFNLATADVLANTAHPGLVVARFRGDDFDRLLYERLGEPKTYRYLRHDAGKGEPELASFVPPPFRETPDGRTATFQAESFWPPRALTGGYAFPVWLPYAGAVREVYVFHGGAPIISVPAHGTRVRLRSCTTEGVCAFGPWTEVAEVAEVAEVTGDRKLPLSAGPLPPESPRSPSIDRENCDSIEVFFPVAGSP